MFKVGSTILSDDIATARFACDPGRCKGACCVVGDAGAPVGQEEVPVLRKAYRQLKDDLRSRAHEVVEEEGVISGSRREGYELNCTDGKECIFVTYTDKGVAQCAIQKAFYEGRFDWEKPISCHLFPLRLKRILDFEYINFEYVPSLCSAGCENGEQNGIWLSDFLEKALVRRYGRSWYSEFLEACREVRKRSKEQKQVEA